jgi:YfiH family protein
MTLPALPDSFYWTDEPWGPALRCRPLSALAPHLFSTRHLQGTTTEGKGWLAASLGAREVATVSQVHGAAVHVVEPAASGTRLDGVPRADVLLSGTPGHGVAVRVADCVPILLASRTRPAVSAVHAGWRGTAAGAATAAVEWLERTFGAAPGDLVAAIGPCIGVCCYEVGSELVDAFATAGHARHLIDRWFSATPPPRGSRERSPLHLDLVQANRDQLVLAGVPEEDIHVAGLCTAMHLDVLTSYRVEREKSGRLVAAISPPTG